MLKKVISLCVVLTLVLTALPLAAQAAVFVGDANRDGAVNILDATHVQMYLIESVDASAVDLEAADVNRDNTVNVLDVTGIQRKLAEIPSEPTAIDVCLSSEPDTLDPARNTAVESATMLAHLFSGLAKWSQKPDGTLEITADAAEELVEGVENTDGTVTYTYTLRDGLTWSDGRAVKASDYAYAWQRAASPALGADYSYLFEVVEGYGDLWNLDEADNPLDPDAKLCVSAPDDKTLIVTLHENVPYWNELLAFPAFFPVRADVAENDAWANDAATYVSNGLYTLQSWAHDDVMVLQKNHNHPDAADVTMDTIRFHLTDDPDEVLRHFSDGSWKLIDMIPGEQIDALKGEYANAFHTEGQLGTYYANWNINEELLPSGSELTGVQAEKARAEIRRALSLLIDRSMIVREITRGGQVPASSFVAMGMTDADGSQFCENCGVSTAFNGYFDPSEAAYSANVERAVAVLKKYYAFDEATGKFTNAPELTYVFNNANAHRDIAAHLQQVFGQLGISVTMQGENWQTYLSLCADGDYSIARNGWVADYNDPITFLDMWTTGSGNNHVQFGRGTHADIAAYDLDLTPYGYDICVNGGTWAQTYDVLIAAIKGCRDKDVRYKLMHLAEDMLMDTGCLIPIYFYTDIYLLNTGVDGFYSNPLGFKYFMYTTIND